MSLNNHELSLVSGRPQPHAVEKPTLLPPKWLVRAQARQAAFEQKVLNSAGSNAARCETDR